MSEASKKKALEAESASKSMVRLIESHNASLHRFEVFRSTMELFFWALRRNDEEYMPIVKRLGDDYVRSAADIQGKCLMEYSEGEVSDILGGVYMEVGFKNDHFGQYFTPNPVAAMMVKMILGDTDKALLDRPQGMKIGEPTCGSGVLALHALNEIKIQHGETGVARTRITCIDIDYLCCLMCSIQLMWFNWMVAEIGEVVVLCGDSLDIEVEKKPVLLFRNTEFTDDEPEPEVGPESLSKPPCGQINLFEL